MKRSASVIGPVLLLWLLPWSRLPAQQRFPHETHAQFFAECTACHAGIPSGEASEVFPDPEFCSACHDGSTAPRLTWKTPEPRQSSLRFTHTPHDFGCETCHYPGGAETLAQLAIPQPEVCMSCHNEGKPHQQAEQCGFCHATALDSRTEGPADVSAFHGPDFVSFHGAAAAAGQPDCTSCHTEQSCLACHEGQSSPSFHPVNFLASHGPEAFGRMSDCTSCHNTEAFCRECHLSLGFEGGEGKLRTAFHDDQGLGFFSHSLGARQDLESCVSCHQQTDCLRCHSAQAGLGVNPHGPGFDASAMRKANDSACRLCHTGGIPGGG